MRPFHGILLVIALAVISSDVVAREVATANGGGGGGKSSVGCMALLASPDKCEPKRCSLICRERIAPPFIVEGHCVPGGCLCKYCVPPALAAQPSNL
ncbi:hypothetical protein BRADI_1g35285v3 [Brachypodium distachyon]|uniref:Knottin scorpion toxin-like domain-containing protein n=1 Tax=Brachypodium distachyon TaxID=15368 RepID=A0A2K2DMR6_BRADI|nr:hypothetical protein BRADI_1g35285v3 [Brachypodium distachyon]